MWNDPLITNKLDFFLQYFELLRAHAPIFVIFPKIANNFERRFEIKRGSASQRRPVDWPRRELAIEGIFFDYMQIFDPVMRGQRLNFGDLVLKIEVFRMSEPIFAKVLKLATCDFHGRVPCTIIYEMACIWSICAFVITTYRLVSLKVVSAARQTRPLGSAHGRPLRAWGVRCCL